jgi:hypothetical protein
MFETGTRLAQEVTGDVAQFIAEAEADAPWRGATVFKTRIRRNIKLAEAPSFGQTIFDYAPSSNGAEDYTQLVEEILAMPSVEELATRELSADELGLAEPPQPEATEPAVSDSESPDQVAEPIEAPVDASQPAP